MAQRTLRLEHPPRAILVVRRGARTARTSPGTAGVEYVDLSDEDIGLDVSGGHQREPQMAGPSGHDVFEQFRFVRKSTRADGPVAQLDGLRT